MKYFVLFCVDRRENVHVCMVQIAGVGSLLMWRYNAMLSFHYRNFILLLLCHCWPFTFAIVIPHCIWNIGNCNATVVCVCASAPVSCIHRFGQSFHTFSRIHCSDGTHACYAGLYEYMLLLLVLLYFIYFFMFIVKNSIQLSSFRLFCSFICRLMPVFFLIQNRLLLRLFHMCMFVCEPYFICVCVCEYMFQSA